jgi:hypothetical protein
MLDCFKDEVTVLYTVKSEEKLTRPVFAAVQYRIATLESRIAALNEILKEMLNNNVTISVSNVEFRLLSLRYEADDCVLR